MKKYNPKESINDDKSNKASDKIVFQRKHKILSNEQIYANKLTE